MNIVKMFGRVVRKTLSNNFHVLLGIVLGVFLFFYQDHYFSSECLFQSSPIKATLVIKNEIATDPYKTPSFKSPIIVNKSAVTNKLSEKVIRPRYYSTELGIREKLFVGVLTSEDRINSRAVYINKTITHVVDKIKFFITVRNKMKTSFNLSGIVGFTDARPKYRPFQIIKYISDTFMQEYDYYFLMNDYNYLNVRKLKDLVGKISVNTDLYLGTLAKDSSFCDLDSGILLSNSIIRAMKLNLDWCISNAITEDHSENLGRCVHYSTNMECQEETRGYSLPAYKLKHFQLEKYLEKLTKSTTFNDALTIYPVLHARDFYLLNAYFSRKRLEKIKLELDELSKDLNESWPPGQRIAAKPATRFDLPLQLYFNMTHMFFPDDFTNIRKHTSADYRDIQKIIEAVKNRVSYSDYENLQYRRLVNGYRTFDLSQGMEYMLDLGFRDLTTGKEVVKRFEVSKPLGKVEIIPAPYVTENTRIAIVLPIEETEADYAIDFINNYNKLIIERKEKTLLMLVLLYQYNSTSKGINDVFGKVKQLATKISARFHNEETKIIWVSIRLPSGNQFITVDKHPVLNFAVTDLALKKIGLDTLTLMLDVYCQFSYEFLNRVRMNTIANFQIFSPIPFRQYNPKVTKTEEFVISKNVGHFDKEQYKYNAFYGKDYVVARKLSQAEIPIIRTDNDINQIIATKHDGNVFKMFVKYSDNLHCMRATEKDLKVKYHEEFNNGQKNLFLGSKVQLAKLLLSNQEKIGFVF